MLRGLVSAGARGLWQASCLGLTKGAPLVRYAMYKQLQALFKNHSLGDNVLSVSHSTLLCELLGADKSKVVEANYPEQRINQLSFPDNTFSAVVSDQVFEHIECTPPQAVAEVWRVLRPGGLAVHTTCFMTPYHGSQDYSDISNGDYWRYTASGLARLHKDYSRVIEAAGWGNAMMPLVGGLGLNRMRVPEAHWHPLNKFALANRPSYAFVVWVVAQK